jgi:hypothetical protein
MHAPRHAELWYVRYPVMAAAEVPATRQTHHAGLLGPLQAMRSSIKYDASVAFGCAESRGLDDNPRDERCASRRPELNATVRLTVAGAENAAVEIIEHSGFVLVRLSVKEALSGQTGSLLTTDTDCLS